MNVQVYISTKPFYDKYLIVWEGSVYTASDEANLPNGILSYIGEIEQRRTLLNEYRPLSSQEIPEGIKQVLPN